MAALNAAAVSEAARFRPDVTLSMHVVASPAAALIRRALGARTVQYFHANEIGGKPRLAAFAARSADVSVAVSSYTAELIAATGAAPTRLSVIPPGVDLPSDRTVERGRHVSDAAGEADGPDEPRDRTHRAGPPTVLTIARLKDSYKGHDVLIRALALVHDRVTERGAGRDRRGAAARRAGSAGGSSGVGDAVRFLGAVSTRSATAGCAARTSSRCRAACPADGLAGEGFGIVYLEAGRTASRWWPATSAGALDAVRDGETGLLVDPTDPRAVADALTRLLLRPRARRRGSVAPAHERAQRSAWPAIAAARGNGAAEQLAERGGAVGRRMTVARRRGRARAAGAADEGPVRQPHRGGQRRRALAAEPARGAAGAVRSTVACPRGRLADTVRDAGGAGARRSSARRGACACTRCTRRGRSAEMSVAAAQVRRIAARAPAPRWCTRTRSVPGSCWASRGPPARRASCTCATACRRAGDERDDAAIAATPRRCGQLPLHRARGAAAAPRARAWRSCTTRWT